MKKLLTLLTLLFCAIGLNAASYDIWVAGTQVTDANKDNITGTGITAGTVKYNPTANMLILNNATIKVSGSNEAILYGIVGGSEFTLKFDGTCYVESSGSRHAIALRGATNIASTGSSPNITVKYTGTSNKQAIYTESNIRITCGGKLTVSSTGDYAIRDYGQVNSFTTNNVITVDATAKTAAIYGFKTMTIPEGSCITDPRPGVWKDSEKTFVTYATGTTPVTHVTIARGYPLWVNGTHVSPDNADDILGDNLVKYSKSSKTLELYGGSFTNTKSAENCIEANQDLTIDVMDVETSFEQTLGGYAAIALRGGHKYKFQGMEGNGTLNVKSNSFGIYLYDGASAEFDHITTNVTSPYNVILAQRGGSLLFNNSDINLNGTSTNNSTIKGITACTFNSCGITSPLGATYDATKQSFMNGSSTVYGKVTIAPTSYGISVMGKDINTRNYETYWTNARYNPTTNTLSINGDLGYSGNVISIKSGKPTTILLGSNTKILSDNASGIYISNTDVTIKKSSSTASAVLNVETKYVKGSGVNTYTPIMNFGNGKLTIEDCTVNTTAEEFGIYTNNSNGTININNATINATIKDNGLFHGALDGFKNINLNKATIKSSAAGIYSKDVTPSIDLTGANTITSSNRHGIFWNGAEGTTASISSKNNGSLNVNAPNSIYCGIMSGPNLTIKDCNATFTSGSSAIIGQSGTQTITVDNATVTAKAGKSTASEGAISNISAFTTKNGVAITSPKNAVYNSTLKGISVNGSTLCKEVTISTEEYGITVGGTAINSKNCANVFGDGKVKYDPATNTLTLNNAGIANEGPGINVDNALKDLTINLIGTNSIMSNKSDGMYLGQRTTITSTSNGSLKVNGNIQGICHYYSFLIKDCTVEASGMNYGIVSAGYSSNYRLDITNASVKATGNKGAFYGYKWSNLVDCYVANPLYDVKFDGSSESLSGFTLNGTMCQTVQILPGTPYAVVVKDVRVSSKNASNVLGDGTVTYDNATKVLTLNNANINATGNGINTQEEITLKLVGDNYINAVSNCITASNTSFTIDGAGSGKLNLKTSGSGAGIYAVGIPMTIKNCTINSEGENGIIGEKNFEKPLVIENANVHVKATKATPSAMKFFSNITLNKCYVEWPNGAAFDATLKGMAEDYGELCKEVEILAGDNPHIVPPVISNPVVKIVDLSHSSIKLSWTAATDNNTTAAEMEYFVLYTNKATSEAKDFYVNGATSTEITGLDPATEYEIKITAIDKDGNLAEYTAFTIKTLNAPDHTCPTLPADASISYHDLTANSVVVTWNPATDDITEPISLMYEIGCRVKGSTTPITYYYLTGDHTSFKFTGLLPETTYEVLMDVFDEAGNESYYEMLTFTTLADADVTKPALPADPTVTVTGTTENSISIKWNPATDDKTAEAAMRYQIDCFISEAWVTKGIVTGTTEFTIDGLEDGTSYQIVVYALDEADNKEIYPLVIGTTLTASAIDAILAKYPDAKMYSLDGKLVDKNYRGIVIINGKKYMKKK